MMASEENFIFSSRFLVTVLCFWSVTNMVYLRLNMSVAIVCMVNHTHLLQRPPRSAESNIAYNSSHPTNSTVSVILDLFTESQRKTVTWNDSSYSGSETSDTVLSQKKEDHGRCDYGSHNQTERDAIGQDGPIVWDAFIQGQVLAAYFYGYAVSKIPTGWMVPRVGGKILILASSLAASAMCLLTPVIATHNEIVTILMRILLGMCGGMIVVSVQSLLNNWSPPLEKSMMGAYTFAGLPCGTLAAFILAGFLCEHGFAGGWPSVFYTFGMFSLLFCLLWAFLVTDSPDLHPCISRSEKEYILASLPGKVTTQNKPHSVPWKSILTSPPVYAVAACAVCTDFVGNVLLLYLPTYLAEVMNFNISSSGLLSALPYVFCFVSMALGGHLSDCLIKRTTLTLTTVRKLTCGFGMLLCIVSLIFISFMGCQQAYVAVGLLVLSVAGIGLMTIGYFVNPMDIAQEYAGVVVGISSMAGDISGFVSPSIVAAITAQGSSQESWQIVFLMSAGVASFCLIFYIIFASGEVQPWAKPPQDVWSQEASNQVGIDVNSRNTQPNSHDGTEDATRRLLYTQTLRKAEQD